MTVPPPMPVISRGVPAYTNDDFSGAFPASNANNAVYGGQNYWRCAQTPVSNANTGTLIAPVYLAYDLSGIASAQRQNVVLAWYNDPSTDPYDSGILSTNYFNSPAAYTIDTNTAAGGSLPGSGWTTQVTVSSETRHSRQHAFNLSGANWVRMNITAINGSISNNNCAINMDVHDAHMANVDNWIFFGDSITQRGFDHDDGFITIGTLPAAINAKAPKNFPLMENGGLGGQKASDIVANNYLSTWLPLFTGRYVGLNYGTNDANAGGSPVTNFQSNMQTLVNAVISAGKIPVIQKTIPWGSTAGIAANGPTVNAALANLFTANPSIIQGPDLWAYFNANQSLISTDGIHPTDPAIGQGNGYIAYRQLWANALLNNVYSLGNANITHRGRGLALPGIGGMSR